MLKITGVETFYGQSQALFGMDLEVREKEMVSLLGRNGMGKTTTVRSIMGMTRAGSGNLNFDGHAIEKLPPHRIARLGIGLVPEGRRIFPNLSVKENLVATARAATFGSGSGSRGWTLSEILDLFPALADRLRHLGDELSGGEQQMLAIGRALMTNPRLLILDEATEGLAPRIRALIWKCLESLKASGLSVLVIDKNLDALTRICDRHYVIEKGRGVWHGTSEELRTDPAIRKKFLGV